MSVDPSAETEAGASAPKPGESAPGLAPGASLGKYRLDRVLGAGGMGVVWGAFDPDLERAVALKVLKSADEPALRTRLLREARAMARLKHPNIVTVYEVGTDRNRDYIAMELVDGDSLDAWLAARPPSAQIAAALIASGRGLAAAHGAGLVHRDFKPHNVLRSRAGDVYVTDFGLARGQIDDGTEVTQEPLAVGAHDLASGARAIDSVLDSPLTQTGVLIGTPAYMAPEQFAGRAPEPRSDQFAFCVTAWEALAGERPFRGGSLDELRVAVGGGAPASGDRLDPRVRAVLARGLEPSPGERWPDMHALIGALEVALAPPITPPKKRRWPLWVGLAALVAVAAGGAIATFAGGSDAPGANGCESPREAFGDIWSPAKRRQVTAAHKDGGEHIAALAMLDDAREKWLQTYDKICSGGNAQQRHEQLACLFEVRDEFANIVTQLLDPNADIEITELVDLETGLAPCGR